MIDSLPFVECIYPMEVSLDVTRVCWLPMQTQTTKVVIPIVKIAFGTELISPINPGIDKIGYKALQFILIWVGAKSGNTEIVEHAKRPDISIEAGWFYASLHEVENPLINNVSRFAICQINHRDFTSPKLLKVDINNQVM